MTKPSRRASNGRETPSRDSAPMRSNAAMHSGVIAASVPPATTTSASPRSIIRLASPIAWLPVAHADETLKPGPWAPSSIAIMPAAALGIIIGTNSGDTARIAAVDERAALVLERLQPADAGADEHREALEVDVAGQAGLLGRPARRRRPRAACSGPSGARPSASSRSSGSKSSTARRHASKPVELDDARAALEQRVEERVRALADRGDDTAAGDGDVEFSPGCVDARGVTPAPPPWPRRGASSARSRRRRTRSA